MKKSLAESQLDWISTLSSDSFLFMSPHGCFTTSGCFCQITSPAENGDDLNSHFQQTLAAAFDSAKSAGIEKPIVVGAIPFETSQSSSLFIPQSIQPIYRQITEGDVELLPTKRVVEQIDIPPKDTFMSMVSDALDMIESGNLDKVVLSRLVEVISDQPFHKNRLLKRLIVQNPDSYNFHVPLLDGSTLMGASPELLLRQENNCYYSKPLAGSARRHTNTRLDDEACLKLLSSKKDHHEHRLVVNEIQKKLSPRSQLLTVMPSPQLLSTPTLWHLVTMIEGVVNTNENALSLACLLHPTPALNGYPYKEAKQLIAQLEPFLREFFGGIVGWCDADGNGEWVVTIRCARVSHKKACLFAGAGIVAGSSPLSEWQETSAKLSTMLNVLGAQ